MSAEVKTIDASKSQREAPRSSYTLERAKEFAEDVKAEVGKITWTTKDELIFYTQVVVIATFLLGLTIYWFGLLIQGTLFSLNYLVNLIAS